MSAKRRERDKAFHSFYLTESERLRRLAIFLTGEPNHADDLAQEALARTYRHWDRIHDTDPGRYARRILVNLVRSAHRSLLLSRKYVQPSPQITDSKAAHIDEYLFVSDALKHLPPVRRATLVLRYYEDLSEAEIARTLDRPLGTVKSDIHRGLKKLRDLLGETAKELT